MSSLNSMLPVSYFYTIPMVQGSKSFSCFAGLHQHTCSIIYYTEKGKQEISKLFVIPEIFCLESQMQKGMYIGIRGNMFSFKGKALIVGT